MTLASDWATQQRARLAPFMLGAVALTTCVLAIVPTPSLFFQLVLLAIGVLVLGMPHGAMDHRVAQRVFEPRIGRRWKRYFAISYLGLFVVVLFCWLVAPRVTLVAFLSYSALHFGLGDCPGRRPWVAFAHGSIPILLPLVFAPRESSELLSWVAASPIHLESLAMVFISCVALAICISMVDSLMTRDYSRAAEVVLLIALNAVAPPLLAFGCYFVLLHSTRHVIELAAWLHPTDPRQGLRQIAVECIPLTLLTLAPMAIALLVMPTPSIEARAVRILFVTLSCLTVPHMLLTAIAERTFRTHRQSIRAVCSSS